MEKTVVFTITRDAYGISLKSNNKLYNNYNCINMPEKKLFKLMNELTYFFNNYLGVAVLFDIE